MDIERRHIKVKRVDPKPHARSFSENNEGISSLTSPFRVRGRSRSDAMFSVVQIKTKKNELAEDENCLERNEIQNSETLPSLVSSPFYPVFDDKHQDEIQNDHLLTGNINKDCVVRRSRSGSGSLVFSSIKVKQDSGFSKARGYPIKLSPKKCPSETPQSCNKEDKESLVWKGRSRTISFSNQSLLHSAISGDDVDELRSLIDSENLDLNLPDEFGITLLHRAAIEGNYRCLNFLLSRGAEVDVTDNEGWTPLHDTVFHGHTRCAVFLLISGADVEAETNDFLKPIEMAEEEEMILVVGRAMALNKGENSKHSNYDKETLV